jgi:hypothetical protein
MTEREVSSERDDAAFLRGMALAYATDDNEHSQKGAARLREIADNILALRSSVKMVADFYAVHSVTGSHIGLWKDEVFARNVLKEYEGGTITPLYTHPTPQEAPSEVTEGLACPVSDGLVEAIYTSVEAHIRTIPLSYGIEPQLTNRLRSVIRIGIHAHNGSLTAALKGDRP